MSIISYPAIEDKKLDRLLTVEEIASILNVKQSHIYTLTSQKRIPHIKMGKQLRFRESAINKWLKDMEVCDNGGT